MKEAYYYQSIDDGKVNCLLCPQECVIVSGKTGVCGVRKNVDGKLISTVFGKPVAIHIDPIEKKPLYHFHPGEEILSIGTIGCNLSCKFCQNYDISQETDSSWANDKLKYVSPEDIIKLCKEQNQKFVAFTYNEPTIFFEYMLDTAKLCKDNGIKTVVVSNGQINEEPLSELIKFIDAFNIDLKSFNTDFYKKICNGNLETTKKTIEFIIQCSKHIEVTFLLIENYNDDIGEFRNMCEYLKNLDNNIVLHISRAFPRYKLKMNVTPVNLLKDFERTARKYLKNVYLGNI